jgi:hypothetical protein
MPDTKIRNLGTMHERDEWLIVYCTESEANTPMESSPTDWSGSHLSNIIIESPQSASRANLVAGHRGAGGEK